MFMLGLQARWVRFQDGMVAWLRAAARAMEQGLEPRHSTTLDLGCFVVLSALIVGLQLGRWSVWSVPLAAAGYLSWVILYSEVTVQLARRGSRR